MIHRLVVPELDRGTVEIDVAAKKSACKFEAACEAVSLRRVVRIVDRIIVVRRHDSPRMKCGETSANDEIPILRRDGLKILLCGGIDTGGFRVVHDVTQ